MPYWAASSRPAPGQAAFHELGQGQVHVVAAQQQVVADRLANEAQLALLLDRLDQAEVAGAAAHVHDQAAGPRLEARPPPRGMGRQPAIKRGLGLFQQGQVFQAGLAGRLHGQVAGHVIERGRHREDHRLLFQPVLGPVAGHDVVPALDQVLEVAAPTPRPAKCAATSGGALQGSKRGGAVHAGMAQPGLGGRHQPAGDARPVVAGELAHGISSAPDPRARRRPGRQVVRPGQIEKGGQQGPVGQLPPGPPAAGWQRPGSPGGRPCRARGLGAASRYRPGHCSWSPGQCRSGKAFRALSFVLRTSSFVLGPWSFGQGISLPHDTVDCSPAAMVTPGHKLMTKDYTQRGKD